MANVEITILKRHRFPHDWIVAKGVERVFKDWIQLVLQ